MSTAEPRTVAIIGGGISGLAIAEAIERRAQAAGAPIRAIVLEADDAAGGKIRSARDQGFVLDTGPHGFLDKEPGVFELIDRLGLRGSVLKANEAAAKRFIVRGGKLRMVPSSPPGFLTSDILPLGAKLRVGMEPFARARTDDDESVWSFAARRIGPTAADVLVDAMVTGIYGGDPKQLSLRSAFPRMRELEDNYGGLMKAQLAIAREKKKQGVQTSSPAGAPTGTLHSFRDGLGELTGALARRATVRTKHNAQRIGRNGGRFVVEGTGEPVEADAVVSTAPAFDVAKMLEPHAPEQARVIAEVPYAPIAVIVQGWRASELGHGLDGFGFLAPHLESRRILGAIWASSVFPEHVPEGMVMLRTMIGGRRRPDLMSLDDAGMLQAAREELVALMGIDPRASPVFERVIRWPIAIPQYDIGHAARVAAADAVETRVPGVFVSGNAFRGVAMIACIVEADRVAERVVKHVLAREGAGTLGAA